MGKEKCSTKFCRNEVDLVYLGRPLCRSCYEKICDEEEKNLGSKCWSCDGSGIKTIQLNVYDVKDVPCPVCGGSGIFVVD